MVLMTLTLLTGLLRQFCDRGLLDWGEVQARKGQLFSNTRYNSRGRPRRRLAFEDFRSDVARGLEEVSRRYGYV